MLLKTLKGRHYFLLMFVPLLILVFWIPALIHPVSLTGDHPQMPVYSLLQSITGGSLTALNIIGVLLLIIMALLMVRLNETYVFIKQRTDLPAFVFVLTSTGTISLLGMHPALLASFFLFFAVERAFRIYNGSRTLGKSFDAGLFVGLASISYLFAGVYLVWFWFALAFLGYFRGREVLAGFLGFLLPVFVVFSLYYLNDSLGGLIATIKNLYAIDIGKEYSLFQKIHWGVLAVFILLASVFMLNVSEEKKISSRKYFTILFIFFLLAALSFLIFRGCEVEAYFLILIPVTYVLSHYFVLSRYSWTVEILFLIFVLAGILVHVLG